MGVIITPYYNPIFAPITFGDPHWIPVSDYLHSSGEVKNDHSQPIQSFATN